jgi:anti-sigma factor RsiW
MPCPDEDTFARFVEGLLPPEAASQIETHVDGCYRCADLAAAFGRSFAEGGPDPAAPSDNRMAPLALAVAAVLHVAWAVVVRGAAGALERIVPLPVAGAYLGYAAIWAPAGGVIALTAAFCLVRRAGPGRLLALGYALLSLPSIVLTPLALLVLDAQRRHHAGT